MAFNEDNNIIIDRDYIDNFSMKQSVLDHLGPKYFGDVELAGLNVGVLGYTMEQIANLAEDSFNTASILMNEAFPNRAIIPESIYSHAAIFQIENLFSKCAICSFILLLDEKEILEYGNKTTSSANQIRFYIDRHTVISVEGIPFTLDYDVEILAQKNIINGAGSTYNYSAKYVIDHKNSISEVNDPYIKIRKTGDNLLMMQVTMHQVERMELSDNIISNTKINYPVLEFPFEGKIAGFDVFYKSPESDSYIQLEKRITFSLPIKQPFCFYKLKNENLLVLEFSSRDTYFQPEFNSEIKVVIYSTKGSDGNFETYNGSKYEITLNSDVYDYNSNMTLAAKTVSPSNGGNDKMDLEALKSLTIEQYSTATEISTESDVASYFYNNKYRYGNEVFVIKRRDDTVERLLSTFILMKNEDYIYPTNTVKISIDEDQFDFFDITRNRFSLKPGHIFTYSSDQNSVELIPDIMCYDKEELKALMEENDKFYFSNPFLISMTKNPSVVGLYQTIANQTASLEYISSNQDTFIQFIASSITLTRGLNNKPEYTLRMNIMPSTDADVEQTIIDNGEVIDDNENNTKTQIINDPIRIIIGFKGDNGDEVGYLEMKREAPTDNKSIITFSGKIVTDDYVTPDGLFKVENLIPKDPELRPEVYLPITNVGINIYIFYDDAISGDNRFSKKFKNMENYILTNIYSNKSDLLTFIKPMNMMRCSVQYSIKKTKNDDFTTHSEISLVPVIKANIVNDDESFNKFVNMLTSNYMYLEQSLPKLRNTTNLDVKFYNTYGKSNNYFISGEKLQPDGTIKDVTELIDTINIKIEFRITFVPGTDDIDTLNKIKKYIKNFIEKLNSDGNNDLYISNLIKGIENNFSEVHHLRFIKINNYNSSYQTIITRVPDLSQLTKEERQNYVPEMLVIDTENIKLVVDSLD